MVVHQPSKLTTRVRFPSLAHSGNSVFSDLEPERFLGFSAQFLVLKDQVRTNGFENGPLDVVRSMGEPI